MTVAHAPQDDAAVVGRTVAVIGQLSGVVAIAQGGSVNAGLADLASDLDFHVYWRSPLAPVAERTSHLATLADADSIQSGEGATSWLLEDHFTVAGRPIELIYIRMADVRAEVEAAYREGFAEEGFTTARLFCFAHDHIVYAQQANSWSNRPASRRAIPRHCGARFSATRVHALHSTQLNSARANNAET